MRPIRNTNIIIKICCCSKFLKDNGAAWPSGAELELSEVEGET